VRSASLFFANGVFQTTNGILDFALNLVCLSFIFGLGVAHGFAGSFLHFALGLLGRAFDATLINHFMLLMLPIRRTFARPGCFMPFHPNAAGTVRQKFSLPCCEYATKLARDA